MTSYEIYVFILCLIVFLLLTVMFSYLIASICKMELELIRHGHRDEQIKKQEKKKESRLWKWAGRGLSALLCLVVMLAFFFSLYIQANEGRPANGIPSVKVVKSESMAEKNPENKYLLENKLNDQIQMFDVVFCQHLPPENELKLYDIVVYQKDDVYVIHRIVGIEEPNEQHPDRRHFLLQGDAVDQTDKFPVLYSQMKGIYQGDRIPFVGSFILFLQSPAGWLCVLLVVLSVVATPLMERKIQEAIQDRLVFFATQEKAKEDSQ